MSAGKAVRRAGLLLAAGLLLSTCGPSIIEEVARDILFAKQYNLTVMSDEHCMAVPEGTVVVTHAEVKAISAMVDAGYHVTGWTHEAGAAVTFANAASSSTTVQLQAGDATIKAWSAPNEFVLTVTAGAAGTTTPSGPVDVASGEARAILATPGTGYHFVNWTQVGPGDIVVFGDASAQSTTVTLNTSSATVQANFAINQYTLTVSHSGTGLTTPSGAVTVDHGVPRSIDADTAGTIYMLESWSITAGTGATIADPADPTTSVTLTGGDATVNAAFVEYHGTQSFVGEHVTFSDTGVYANRVYVAYYDATNGDLLFRQSIDYGKTWGAPVTIDSAGDVGSYCSMTVYKVPMLDFRIIGIAYYDATNQDLKYAYFVDSIMSVMIVVVDSAGDVGQYCQMAYTETPSMKRCIAYYDATNGNLKIAKTSDGGAGTWFCEPVDTSANNVGAHCSITCNSGGDFFLAYADTTANDVKRAWATAVPMDSATPLWTIGTFNYTATVQYTGIALNGTSGVIAFRGNNSLKALLSTNSFSTVGTSYVDIESANGMGECARIRYDPDDAAFWVCHNQNLILGPSGTHQTLLEQSTDNGATWSQIPAAYVSGGTQTMKAASFARSGSRVYVTYAYYDGTNRFLRLMKSTDGGLTW